MKMYKKLKAKGSSLHRKISKRHNKQSTSHEEIVGDIIHSLETQTKTEDITSTDIQGLLYEGDCFYEAEESLIEYSDEEDQDTKHVIQR